MRKKNNKKNTNFRYTEATSISFSGSEWNRMVDEVSTLNTQLSRAKNLLKMEKIEKNRLVGENAKLRKARKKNTNEYHD